MPGGGCPAGRFGGRSAGRSTRRVSTARPDTSAPASESPSSTDAGVRTTSHSSRTPRATASSGSKLRARSRYATIEPLACASAASRSASVVFPLEWSPRTATLASRGTPPGPRIASSPANPVGMTRPSAERPAGRPAGRSAGGSPGSSAGGSAGRGAVASAPTTSPPHRGAAAPQRSRRDARAAVTSGEGGAMGAPSIERSFYRSRGNTSLSSPRPGGRVVRPECCTPQNQPGTRRPTGARAWRFVPPCPVRRCPQWHTAAEPTFSLRIASRVTEP